MSLFIPWIVATAGLVFGSFITCASYRLPHDEDIIRKPSYCPNCTTKLRVPDLIPLFSWLFGRGKCRHCKVTISARYPLIELATAALFLLVYHYYGITAHAVILMAMVVALMVMIVADLEHYIIPDEVHVWLVGLFLLDWWLVGRDMGDALKGAAAGLGLGLALSYGYLWLRKKDGLGFGDVKFLCVSGLWLGLLALIPFLVFSGVLGVVNALIWRALGKGIYFPFGPSLAMSLFACVAFPDIPLAFWEGMEQIRNSIQ